MENSNLLKFLLMVGLFNQLISLRIKGERINSKENLLRGSSNGLRNLMWNSNPNNN